MKSPQYDQPLKPQDIPSKIPKPSAEEIDEFGEDEVVVPGAIEFAQLRIKEAKQNG